jgi:hypothetical protein
MYALEETAGILRLKSAIAAGRVLVAGWRLQYALKRNSRWHLQPRVPAGNSDGGQWTDGGAEGSVIFVQNRPRGSGGGMGRIAGRQVDLTPAQATRLEISHAQMQAAIRRVQELEPRWKPRPSAYETVEGEIAANQGATRQALDRLAELQRVGIGPGVFAVESQPARGPSRRWTAEEIRENNRIGRTYGCHTCGTRDPGTRNGNFVLDHQRSTALNNEGAAQRIFPQCQTCSNRQGGSVRGLIHRSYHDPND